MKHNKVMLFVGLVVVFSMLLSACGPTEVIKTVEVVKEVEKEVVKEVEKEVVVEVTPTPQPTTRKGAWVDTVIFTEQNSAEAAVSQLKAGEIDVYAYTVSDPVLFDEVKESPELAYSNSFGSVSEITFNPAPFTDGRINPFSNPKIREAVNWIIDRNYVIQEIYGGLGVAKYFTITAAFPDYARYVGVVRALEAKYAYNLDKAKEVIAAEMVGMGATVTADGKFLVNGEPMYPLFFIIRVEDERRQVGDYVAGQLEAVGFNVDRQYKTRSEASPLWVRSNPADGLWNVYTGGWITTAVDRDQGDNFSFYYTPNDYPIPLFQAYSPTEEFNSIALKLRNNDFGTMEERGELFSKALELSMQDSARVWVADANSFSPLKAGVTVAYDLAGAIAGSQLWPYTIRWTGEEGGAMKIAQPGILVDPWNPVAGSNWIYDMMPVRATADWGVISDPYTGLVWPQRIEKAEIVAKEGLPIDKTLDWVTLEFAPQIDVPADAWADWDATTQKFITVGEKYPEGATANIKSVVYYPEELFSTKWHDGSAVTVGDFVMNMITTFDYGKPESANYDEALAETLAAFQAHFKAVKVVSTDPLVIETYDDLYQLDAELNVNTWYPTYTYGPGPWHTVALGNRADAAKQLAFSADKADAEGVEWMSMISGPSLEILKGELDAAAADEFVPYAATMNKFVERSEIIGRWINLKTWYGEKGHFWVGSGPFYLYKVFPVEGTVMLQRDPDFVDMSNKWDRFGAPMLAETEVDGPGQVAVGAEAMFDVFVTYKGKPYPSAEIAVVKYLVFNANGEVVATGEAEAAGEGQFSVKLGADATGKLVSGANKIEVAVSPKSVSVPSFAAFEFVTP